MDKRHNGYYASQFTNSHVASLKITTPQTPVSIENDSSSEDDDDDKKKPVEGEIRSLAAYFMFSEEEAANKLNISKSKLKRIKKRLNITRWPYRRVSVNMKNTNCWCSYRVYRKKFQTWNPCWKHHDCKETTVQH
jgi:hypothetical protein